MDFWTGRTTIFSCGMINGFLDFFFPIRVGITNYIRMVLWNLLTINYHDYAMYLVGRTRTDSDRPEFRPYFYRINDQDLPLQNLYFFF